MNNKNTKQEVSMTNNKTETDNNNDGDSVMKKVGKNDKCHCGLNNKYKKCCLRQDELKNKKNDKQENEVDLEFRGKYMTNDEGETISKRDVRKVDKVVVKTWSCDYKTHNSYGYGFEVIDLNNNSNFKDCETIWEIEENYEYYWNRLNPIGCGWRNQDIVKVVKVYDYEDFCWKYCKSEDRQNLLNSMNYPIFKNELKMIFNQVGEDLLKLIENDNLKMNKLIGEI